MQEKDSKETLENLFSCLHSEVCIGVIIADEESRSLRRDLKLGRVSADDKRWKKFESTERAIEKDYFHFSKQAGDPNACVSIKPSSGYDLILHSSGKAFAADYLLRAKQNFPSHTFIISIDPDNYLNKYELL